MFFVDLVSRVRLVKLFWFLVVDAMLSPSERSLGVWLAADGASGRSTAARFPFPPKVAKTEAHLRSSLRPDSADEETLRALPAEGQQGSHVLEEVWALLQVITICFLRRL